MGSKIPNPNINSQLKVHNHAKNLHVMSDKQLEFVKTLVQWLREKQVNDPENYTRLYNKYILMLNTIVRTRQYKSEDRADLNKLRFLYIAEKT